MPPFLVQSERQVEPVIPVLRWAGSKRKQLATLEHYWSPHFKRYVEPFAGSAALFFRVQPERAVLGDINVGLIETYGVIRANPDAIHRAVTAIPRSEKRYYAERARNPQRLSRFNRAVRFFYLNRYCFNGIYRTNVNGEFNVPYAHQKPGIIPPIEHLRKCAILLNRARLCCTDFGSILSSVRHGDFVYLDPPYAVASRRVFRQYDSREFTRNDLLRLGKHLHTMHDKGASFVLSYADCREARILGKPWYVRRVLVRRHVAGFGDARRSAFELLITNFSPEPRNAG